MGVLLVTVLLVGTVVVCEKTPLSRVAEPVVDQTDNALANTELVLAFVIFRHGDRTPDLEELALYPTDRNLSPNLFFPYGTKALTNKGKQRSYFVGKYLRHMYDGFVSRLYLPDEITIRTTNYARTKMTALAALSGMYPPLPMQKWNPNLDWQPIPYNTEAYEEDDLMYWYNCPKYPQLRDKAYETEGIKKLLEPYKGLFRNLSEHTGTNVTKPEDVFYLDNLFQTLNNVGVGPPSWAQDVMPEIKNMTKIEYTVEYYNADLIKFSSGVLMNFIINATDSAIQNKTKPEPKLHLFSAHENNVAGLMAAAKVFEPHQPNYGSTFSLELRRNIFTQEYGINTIYAANAGGPGKLLPIKACGGKPICKYEKFVALVQDVILSKGEFLKECKSPL